MTRDIFGLVVIVLIVFTLYRLNILKFNTISKKSKQSNKQLTVTYKKLKGLDIFGFLLKKNMHYLMHYEVEISEGSMEIVFYDRWRNKILRKVFRENDSGVIEFDTKRRLHRLSIEGKQARGTCMVRFEKKEETKEHE